MRIASPIGMFRENGLDGEVPSTKDYSRLSRKTFFTSYRLLQALGLGIRHLSALVLLSRSFSFSVDDVRFLYSSHTSIRDTSTG